MVTDSTEYIYVLGDGDKIREIVEYHLFNHDLEALTKFSLSLTNAINSLKDLATSTMNARVIIAGGDDILLLVPLEKYRKELVQRLQEVFYNATGVTISFGIGRTVETVYINLRKAKTAKNNKIVEEAK